MTHPSVTQDPESRSVAFTAVEHSVQLDTALTILLNLHNTRRRLMSAIERRHSRGQPVEDLEMELAFNRLEVKAMLAEFF